jgi:tRNA G18 (ribose-2'-O)-methylase SpoU
MRKLKLKELKRKGVDEFKKTEKTPMIVVLDNIRSGLNVGSAFRTSDAFALEKVLLCGITARPPHREILKTAIGATSSMEWKYFEKTTDAIAALKREGYRVVAVEQAENSTMLQDFTAAKKEKIALVFGNEVSGVSEEAMEAVDECIEVPQFGTKHSLNISVCIGVVVWDLYKKVAGF